MYMYIYDLYVIKVKSLKVPKLMDIHESITQIYKSVDGEIFSHVCGQRQ